MYQDVALSGTSAAFLDAEWIDESLLRDRNWPSLLESLRQLHDPKDTDALDNIKSRARQRLAFDELLVLELGRIQQEHTRRLRFEAFNPGTKEYNFSIPCDNLYRNIVTSALSFDLTVCQQRAIDEIQSDLSSATRMVRLVQGDVGSGKTIVSVMALLQALEAGKQVAFLAPTEILARQHFQNVQKYLDVVNRHMIAQSPDFTLLTVQLITGSIRGAARTEIMQDMKSKTVHVVIGTHSLLSHDVVTSFNKLGLVIIDEEQRFGVDQRNILSQITNTIYTTATPIPRSLMMLTQSSVSSLITKLPVKRPVKTVLYDAKDVDAVIEILSSNIPFGTKIFWVTPSLSQSDAFVGSSAEERYAQLSKLFPGRVGLLHGKLPSSEKERLIARFSQSGLGDTDELPPLSVLVSTTVVEVGIDIPDASICIIDRANYFGLSQIHQIRGRIGRGAKPKDEKLAECLCILLKYSASSNEEILVNEENASEIVPEISAEAMKRLNFLIETDDCFRIAEFDLELRGPGDLYGFRQSGKHKYRVASMPAHMPLLIEARKAAQEIWNGAYIRPDITADHPTIRALTGLFERDDNVAAMEDEPDATFYFDYTISGNAYDPVGVPVAEIDPLASSSSVESSYNVNGSIASEIDQSLLAINQPKIDLPSPIDDILISTSEVVEMEIVSLVETEPIRKVRKELRGSKSDFSTNNEILTTKTPLTIRDSLTAELLESIASENSQYDSVTLVGPPTKDRFLPVRRGLGVTSTVGEKLKRSGNSQISIDSSIDDPIVIQESETADLHSLFRLSFDYDGPATVDPIVVVLDLEATGLSTQRERIIQIGAKVLGDHSEEGTFNAYVRPKGKTVDISIQTLTGISQSFLDEHGMEFIDAWSDFQAWLLDRALINDFSVNSDIMSNPPNSYRPVIFVAHSGKSYDFPLLQAEIDRLTQRAFTSVSDYFANNIALESIKDRNWFEPVHGKNNGNDNMSIPKSTAKFPSYCFMDSYVVLRDSSLWNGKKTGPHDPSKLNEPEKFNLGTLYKHVTGEALENGHNALFDVLALETVLECKQIDWRRVGQKKLFN